MLVPSARSVELLHVSVDTAEQRPVSQVSMGGMTLWEEERATRGTRPAMLRHSPPGPRASEVRADEQPEEMERLPVQREVCRVRVRVSKKVQVRTRWLWMRRGRGWQRRVWTWRQESESK